MTMIIIMIMIMCCRFSQHMKVLGWAVGLGYEGPGFNPGRCQLYGLRVRHFKVSGECLRLLSNHNLYLNGRLAESKKEKRNVAALANAPFRRLCLPFRGPLYIYIYIYIYIYTHTYIYIYIWRERER